MFNQLIESKRTKKRSPGTTAFSVGLHATLIGLAAWATANAAIRNEKPKSEKIEFVQVKKDEPPPPKKDIPPPPKDVTVAPPPPKGFQVLQAPPIVPVKIPDIDLSKKVTNEADFSGKGVAGGTSKGVVGGTGPVSDNQTYFSYQVERPAAALSSSPSPSYPEALRSAAIDGEVEAQFVVDTSGRGTDLQILKSSNELFAAAVKTAFPRMRFSPAEIGGKKVKQLVVQPFNFTISH
ncbi:MAG: energy transducer TonB [Gemmatimonadota bacterium]|nr:energy transducer TonB [Gemmatimonadota bacterium]